MLFSSSVRVSIRFSVWLVSCYAHVFVLATLGCNCYTATCIRSCWVIICCMLLFRRRSLRGHCWSRDAQQRSAMGRNAYVRRYAYSICHIYDGAVITTWLCYRMVHKTRGTIPFCIFHTVYIRPVDTTLASSEWVMTVFVQRSTSVLVLLQHVSSMQLSARYDGVRPCMLLNTVIANNVCAINNT